MYECINISNHLVSQDTQSLTPFVISSILIFISGLACRYPVKDQYHVTRRLENLRTLLSNKYSVNIDLMLKTTNINIGSQNVLNILALIQLGFKDETLLA